MVAVRLSHRSANSPIPVSRNTVEWAKRKEVTGRRSRGIIRSTMSRICVKRKKTPTKNLTQDDPSLDRDVNQDPPEYDAEVIILIHTISTIMIKWRHTTVRDLVRLLTLSAHSRPDQCILRSGNWLNYTHYKHTHDQIKVYYGQEIG